MWGKKITLLYMQSYNPAIPGCTFSKLLSGRQARCGFQCCGFLLLTLITMQSNRQSEFCANLMYHESNPGQVGYPTLKRLHGKV